MYTLPVRFSIAFYVERGPTMRRLFLPLALLVVLGSSTMVQADELPVTAGGLREPSFPGGNAGEGDLMTYNLPDGTAIVIGDLLSLL